MPSLTYPEVRPPEGFPGFSAVRHAEQLVGPNRLRGFEVLLRRFKKLLERSGLSRELRKRRHYEKPSELRRRAKARKQVAAAKALAARALGKPAK